MTDSKTTITSYIELLRLLEAKRNETVNYGTLYCKRKHKSKLKIARKSHYKKKENTEVFLENLVNKLEEYRIILDKNNLKSVNLYFQDESRFGLITK